MHEKHLCLSVADAEQSAVWFRCLSCLVKLDTDAAEERARTAARAAARAGGRAGAAAPPAAAAPRRRRAQGARDGRRRGRRLCGREREARDGAGGAALEGAAGDDQDAHHPALGVRARVALCAPRDARVVQGRDAEALGLRVRASRAAAAQAGAAGEREDARPRGLRRARRRPLRPALCARAVGERAVTAVLRHRRRRARRAGAGARRER
eukprot:310355-Prymnesium_polylepis.1